MRKQTPEPVALLTDYAATTAYSTAFATAFANIRFNWDQEQHQQLSLLLTTPTDYTQRATAVANIAIAAAQTGTPTLLVDADFTTACLPQSFGLATTAGLSDLLQIDDLTANQTQIQISQAITKTSIPHLFLLGAGSGTQPLYETSRLLTATFSQLLPGLRHFLATTTTQPGLIIFNSAPVLTQIDAATISACVDQTFLLLASGQTTRKQSRLAREQLERAHAHLTGVILLDA
ncbi:hypothetical protein [Tengunoibacter tsumagoiensis]|uniref:Tyrosine-protein kinase CpsD n=1 Tax=Tengunoibacter tsumagoiensis TaxID=2014871 RepID=A0A401ZXV9_9CHLR|nr:hypothetical protein [Tengunoibacter tsumagoiensis]GCE11672.1 tyrosine-protein kinase CpsD [Tengunoibacter tsumagoiensis]